MGIEDDIAKGADEARRQMEYARQHATERAVHEAKIKIFLDRFRERAHGRYQPTLLYCLRRRIFGKDYKVVPRDGWKISDHYASIGGQRVIYQLWLDDTSAELWWKEADKPARLHDCTTARLHDCTN